MYPTIGNHLVRFSLIIGFALLSLMLWDSALVFQGAEARPAVRSTPSICAWKQREWSSMSSAQRQLWTRLGWTQTRWDSDNPKMAPSSEARSWTGLTAGERNAASQLGFSQKNWEAVCPPSSRSSSTSERSKAALDNIVN
jgi:hypothetical protein